MGNKDFRFTNSHRIYQVQTLMYFFVVLYYVLEVEELVFLMQAAVYTLSSPYSVVVTRDDIEVSF